MTNLSASDRSQIYSELTEATSEETAEVIMATVLDAPWDRVDARFAQVDARFAQVDARFAQVDSRFEQLDVRLEAMQTRTDARFDALQARTEATLERALRSQTIWVVSAMFAFNGLLAAWITAFT